MTLQGCLSAVWRRSQLLFPITFLGVGVCTVCLHSLSWHTQIHGLDWGFTLELLAGYCGWTESDLLLNNVNFRFTNSEVQISSAESSSGSRAGNLALELKSWCTDPLSWMAFVEEKERAVEPAGQHPLRFTEPQEDFLVMVSSWCPAYVPTMAPAHQVLVKVVDSKLKVRRKMFQHLNLEKGNYTGESIRNPNSNLASELGRPIQNLLHCRPLGSGTEIKKSWNIKGMVLGGFPAVHDFFPHQDVAPRMLSLVLICYFLSWFQKTAVKHTAVELKLLNF